MGHPTPDSEAKQDHARDLRIAGWTFAQIAEAADPTAPDGVLRPLYGSPGSARNAVIAANTRHGGDLVDDGRTIAVSAGERRTLVGDQLMEMVKAWMPAAQGGDEKAAKIVRDCLRDYSELFGIRMKAAVAPAETKLPAAQAAKEDPADEIARRRASRLASGGGAAPAGTAPTE